MQSESRISAHTWRQWCSQLQLDVVEAIDVWDEICLPLMMLSRKAPDVPFVLQAWMARPDLDLITFREELPAALHILAFVASLQDESLSGAGFKSGILKIFRRVATSPGEVPPPLEIRRRQFVVELTSVILITKVIKGENISLPGVIKVLAEGRGTLDDLVRMAKKAAGTGRVADAVMACLECRVAALNEAVAEAEADDDEDEDDELDEDAADGTEGNGADGKAEEDSEEETEESGDGEFEDEDDEELEDEDDLDEAFEAPRPANATENFLYHAKAAFKLIYAAEANKDKEIPRELLVKRLDSVDKFEPLRAYVPTHEEAQAMMRKGQIEQSGGREKTLMKARAGGGGGARSSGGGKGAGGPISGGGGAAEGGLAAPTSAGVSMGPGGGSAKKPTVIKGGAATGKAAAVTASGFSEYAGEEDDEDTEEGLDLVEVSEAGLEEAVRQIGALLENVTAADPDVWALFLQPDAELDDVCSLSKRLSQEGTGAQQAATAIETIGRMQNIKVLLALPEDKRIKARDLAIDVDVFVKNTCKTRRSLEPNSRGLMPVPPILDHAGSLSLRLRALQLAYEQSNTTEVPSREMIADDCERVLSAVTYKLDQAVLQTVRTRMDEEIAELLEQLAAGHFADKLVEASTACAESLQAEGHCESLEKLEKALAEGPLTFEDVEGNASKPADVPEELVRPSGLGEIFDAVRRYVFERLRFILQPIHEPEATFRRVDAGLKKVLAAVAVLEPRKERHHRNPRVALSVVSLEKVTGNNALASLFVRLGVDGRLLYLEDFEDGTYIDVFELRENTTAQVHARARDRARSDRKAELQVGVSYLYSLGRTNELFCSSREDVLESCIKNDEGETKIFPMFSS